MGNRLGFNYNNRINFILPFLQADFILYCRKKQVCRYVDKEYKIMIGFKEKLIQQFGFSESDWETTKEYFLLRYLNLKNISSNRARLPIN